VAGITKEQVHGHFATITRGAGGTNVDFGGTDLKATGPVGVANSGYACEGKFLPMR